MATKLKSRPAAKPKPAAKSHSVSKSQPAKSASSSKSNATAKAPTAKSGSVVKARSRPATTSSDQETIPEAWHIGPVNQEECLERIETLGGRVEGYIKFMYKIDAVRGTSNEAKQKALVAFYERLFFLERELGRIQEELQLG